MLTVASSSPEYKQLAPSTVTQTEVVLQSVKKATRVNSTLINKFATFLDEPNAPPTPKGILKDSKAVKRTAASIDIETGTSRKKKSSMIENQGLGPIIPDSRSPSKGSRMPKVVNVRKSKRRSSQGIPI